MIRDAIAESRLFFTADTHFGSMRHLELSKRPFDSVEEMDDAIVDNWNAKVPEDGLVIHQGDFGDLGVLDRLNGNILLLPGNYDHTVEFLDGMMPWQSCEKMLMLAGMRYSITTGAMMEHSSGLQLTHEPSNADWTIDEFVLYAHCHCQKFKRGGVNVGVDCHHFRPLSLDEVLFWSTAVMVFYDEEVFHPGRS